MYNEAATGNAAGCHQDYNVAALVVRLFLPISNSMLIFSFKLA